MTAAAFARRELRGGWRGFRVLVACLALGVAAVAAAGSLRAAFHQTLDEDARALLGGDIELRQSYQPITPDQRALLGSLGRLSESVDMRAMARRADGEARRLVEVKAVDSRYPLVGRLDLEPAVPDALGKRDGVWGAAAEAGLLERLGLAVGDEVMVGEARFRLRAVIAKEPDRIATAFAFGPRLLIAAEALPDTGLIVPGAVVRHVARLALAPGIGLAEAKHTLAQRFPDAAWQLRDTAQAAPGLARFLDNLSAFLTLVGLTALLVGGIGVANAVKAYLDGRLGTIAILKCLGAPSATVFATYGLLIAAMAAAGIAIGLVAGAAAPYLTVALAAERLPLALRPSVYPAPLAAAAAIGALTALVFALWPLARARLLPATALFRRLAEPPKGRPDRATLAVLAVAAAGLAALAVTTSERTGLAAAFVAASVATLGLFRALAWALSRLAARLSGRRAGVFAHPSLRLALANLHRPGSAVVAMVLSLGLGLTVLVALAQVEGNLARQFGETMPAQAPSFFFIDIQADQIGPFAEIVRTTAPAAQVETAPLVRARVSRINGIPVDQVNIAPEVEWAVRGERGLTAAATPPPGTRLVAGSWWPADWQGPPLASVDAEVAKGFGIRPGDTLAVNVLGREIELKVASLRQIEWSTLAMNFTFIVSPDTLAGAPMSWIATVRAPDAQESAVERAVTDRLPNVSAIRVREAIESVKAIIANTDLAVRMAALVTLTAGALVLAAAVLAGQRRRISEAVILKVLGATSGDLWRAWLVEFGTVGITTGVAAGGVGSLAAWAILTRVMRAEWTFLPGVATATLAACVAASLAAGFVGTFLALRAKAAPYLRGE